MERTRPWREYCCESFCDTASWLHSGCDSENTLAAVRRRTRTAWFMANFAEGTFLF